jgi:hypothetical protein
MFAVSYVTAEGTPKHYLIKDSDTAGNKKTLPDFLNDYKELLYILKVAYNPHIQRHEFECILKDVALSDYYSRKGEVAHTGYDDRIKMQE